ncbi:hypothetical protein KL86DES1_10614 [uncultured Desulfovibrio sp.]|uniref:Uncharacterized protein n=1 Tax=uncultured Desulfovibrio sp. TaxID=167968 RepID=A0A212KZQ9_9BACT|nr:hypothetical protein KL86DES1_10614 [uncultured Desulfovibrio sp.]VZH32489.1 conserved protein of unknown function [Desulfovibrio sp. 86]
MAGKYPGAPIAVRATVRIRRRNGGCLIVSTAGWRAKVYNPNCSLTRTRQGGSCSAI